MVSELTYAQRRRGKHSSISTQGVTRDHGIIMHCWKSHGTIFHVLPAKTEVVREPRVAIYGFTIHTNKVEICLAVKRESVRHGGENA